MHGVGAEQGAFQIHPREQRAQRRDFVALFADGHRAQRGVKQVAHEREQRQRPAFAARAAAEHFAVDGQPRDLPGLLLAEPAGDDRLAVGGIDQLKHAQESRVARRHVAVGLFIIVTAQRAQLPAREPAADILVSKSRRTASAFEVRLG
jgi:hypothetical protein